MTARIPAALDDVPALALFVDVVSAGSFSRAAKRRGLTTSAVSKRIAQLEARVGLQLLARTTRRLSATDAGRRLLARAEHVLGALTDAEQELSELARTPKGRLRVATSVSLGQSHVGRIASAFAFDRPGVSVELSLDEEHVDLVAGRFDLAVRCGVPRDPGLTVKKLVASRRILCASPAYLGRRGAPARAEDLADHECLRHVLEDRGSTWRFGGAEESFEVRVEGSFHADNTFVLRDAAVAGAGIAFLPTFVVSDDVRAGRLQIVLEGMAAEKGWIHVAFPGGRPSRLARVFADFVSAQIVETLG